MKKSVAGFALIETIVAIVLLAGVLGSAVSLMVGASRASDRNRDRVTATFLAQEGLELARNARDTAWKFHLPYDCSFGDLPAVPNAVHFAISWNPAADAPPACFEKSLGIAVEKISGATQKERDENTPAVTLPNKSGAPVPSKFKRSLAVSRSTTPDGVTVTSRVIFPTTGHTTETVEMSEILTNWRQK